MNRIRRKPDFCIKSQFHYEFNRSEILRSLNGKSGIYIFKSRGIAYYVGASRDLGSRAMRIYRKKPGNFPKLFWAIVKTMKENPIKYDLKTEIFFYPVENLMIKESAYFKKLNPISQAFEEYIPSWRHLGGKK